MIRCLFAASIGLHVAIFAALPSRPRSVARPVELTSLIEVANEPPPPPPPKEEPPVPTAQPTSPPRAPLPVTAHVAVAATANPTGPTTNAPAGVAVDGDGPADFTASVISNAAAGPASKIVVSAPASAKTAPPEPKMVPVSSLSRRPGAPGLDAELERNYPIEARHSGISGTAKLRVQIFADGRVGRVERVSETYAGFGDACAKTVRAARWEPPLDADGRAVATEIVYVCKFEVRS